MAARRVLIFVLAFFAGVSLVAALLPPVATPPGADSTTEDSTGGGEGDGAPEPRPDGELVRARIEAGVGERQTIRAEVGDQLELQVFARPSGEVTLPDLGPTAFADRLAPARFVVRLSQPGVYEVERLENRKVLGRIVVAPSDGKGGPRSRAPDAPGSRAPQESDSGESSERPSPA